MIKRFLCILLVVFLGINVVRIGINSQFWNYTDQQKINYMVNADYILTTLSDFSEDYDDLIIDIFYLRDRFIYSWNDGFASGLISFFSKTIPDIVRVFIDVLNIGLDILNVVFSLVGLPSFGNIPLWERDNPRVYPPGTGGGGGARGSLAPLFSGVSVRKGGVHRPRNAKMLLLLDNGNILGQ